MLNSLRIVNDYNMERLCAAVGEDFDEFKIKGFPATVQTLNKQFPMEVFDDTPCVLYCCCPVGHTWKYDPDGGVPDFCVYCNMWYADYGRASASQRDENICGAKMKSRGRVIRLFPVADIKFQIRVRHDIVVAGGKFGKSGEFFWG